MSNIYARVRPYTMVCETGVWFTIEQTVRVIEENVPGELVECGTWRGGCALAMLLAQRERFGHVVRTVHLMDSFEGLPPAGPKDGEAAHAWQQSGKLDNCRASLNDVHSMMTAHGFKVSDYHIWPGQFERTLPVVQDKIRDIALLRVDCDWYESVRDVLKSIESNVNRNGTVIVDDYYAWDGCALATHEYLSTYSTGAPRLRSLPDFSSAYWYKK